MSPWPRARQSHGRPAVTAPLVLAAPARTAVAPRCAVLARALAEPTRGTAATVRSWLCIEEPGAWPRDIVDRVLRAALPEPRRRELAALTDTEGLRVQVVRRTTARREGRGRTVLMAGSSEGRTWLERVVLDDLRQLADLDLAGVAAPGHVAGAHGEVLDEAYLVCTHGTKDRCCAVEGRVLATALAERFGDAVWEASHVGGDRFAANLVALPQGLYYGRLDEVSGAAVVEGLRAGQVPLTGLRGRASLAPVEQAAEIVVRERLAERVAERVAETLAEPRTGDVARHRVRVHDVRVLGSAVDPATRTHVVRLTVDGREVLLPMLREPTGECAESVCHGLLRPGRWVADGAQLNDLTTRVA